MPGARKVVLDTNFLLIPGQFGVDIFSELERICHFDYKLYIIDLSLKEIENILKKQKGRDKQAAKLALALLKHKSVIVLKTSKESADEALLALHDVIVATQDMELRARLKAKGMPRIILRQKKYLVLEE